MRLVISTLTYLFILGTTDFLHAQDKHYHKQIEKLIRHETVIDFKIVPTVIVVSVDYNFSSLDTFGVKLTEDSNNWNPAIWELGSVSKPFIAVLAKEALAQLGLSEDSQVCTVMPDSLCHAHWSIISFKQLLEHRAGLPLTTTGMAQAEKDVQDPYKDYHLSNLERDIMEIDPVPGQYSYSHLGYAALYWLFEKVGGLHLFMEQYFTDDTGVGVYDQVPDSMLIPGHGLNGKITANWHPSVLTTALGLKTDALSLYQFVSGWFADEDDMFAEPDPELLRELEVYDQKKEFKVIDGWLVWRKGKSIVYYMHGHTGGHAVSVAFIPAEYKCAMVFANGAAGTQDLSLLVLDMLQRGKKE